MELQFVVVLSHQEQPGLAGVHVTVDTIEHGLIDGHRRYGLCSTRVVIDVHRVYDRVATKR